MHRVGAARARRFKDAVYGQVALRRFRRTEVKRLVRQLGMRRLAVRRRVHRDGAQPELARRAHDAHGDFSPVGNQ